MTIRPRYTWTHKARDLATLARVVGGSIRPALEIGAKTALIILTTRYVDPKAHR